MSNTSATGGYLTPDVATPDEDQALRRFLHDVLAGVTGLDNGLVRPAWQVNPPKTPDLDVDWLGFSVSEQRGDDAPFHEQHDDGSATLVRHEEVDVHCVFYGPGCMNFANRLRDGLYLSQNREALRSVGAGVVGFSPTVHSPELAGERFVDRSDVTMTLRREVKRDYPVLHFVGAYGEIDANRAGTTLIREWSAGEARI